MDNQSSSGAIFQGWIKGYLAPRTVIDMAAMLGLTNQTLYKSWFNKNLSSSQLTRIFESLRKEKIASGKVLRLAQMLKQHPAHEADSFLSTVIHKKGDLNTSDDSNDIVADSPANYESSNIGNIDASQIEQLSAQFAKKDEDLSRALDIIKAQQEEMKELRLMLKDALSQ